MQSSQQSCDNSRTGKQGQAGPGDRPQRKTQWLCLAMGAHFICPGQGGDQHPGPVCEGSCNFCGRSCNRCFRDKAETALLTLSPKAKVLKVKKPLAWKCFCSAKHLERCGRKLSEQVNCFPQQQVVPLATAWSKRPNKSKQGHSRRARFSQ